MDKKRLIKYGIVLVVLVGGSVGMWNLAKFVVSKGYSSTDIVREGMESTTEMQGEVPTTETDVITTEEVLNNVFEEVDYSDHKPVYTVDNSSDEYNRKMQIMSEVNGKSIDEIKPFFTKLSSYYYGDYNKDYQQDLNQFLKNMPELQGWLESVNVNDINKEIEKTSEADILKNKYTMVKNYGLGELNEIKEDEEASIHGVILVGIIQGKYYVYANKDYHENDTLLVLDKSSSLILKTPEATDDMVCQKLGEEVNIMLYKSNMVYATINEREVIIAKEQ